MKKKAKFILSKSKVLKQLKIINEISDSVSYSLKTNFEVGKILEKDSNCFFSVHSLESLELIKDKSRVWFFGQSWNMNELKLLVDRGVYNFVIDNQNDLKIFLEFIKNKKNKFNLLLRFRLKENTIHTGKHFVFGMRANEINLLIPKIRNIKNINKIGIHFHRKTQNVSEWSLKEELKDSIKILDSIDFVNIGGGIPIPYKNHRPEILKNIFSKIKEVKEFLNSKGIKLIIEPGRFIAGPSINLETEIINIYENNIAINASVYNCAMDTFIANIRLLIDNELNFGERYVIKGCTPDSMDIFRYSVFLNKPRIGQKITFLNAGAYNFSTDFCKLPKLKTEVIE
jgi:ornithine decarboxylase